MWLLAVGDGGVDSLTGKQRVDSAVEDIEVLVRMKLKPCFGGFDLARLLVGGEEIAGAEEVGSHLTEGFGDPERRRY